MFAVWSLQFYSSQYVFLWRGYKPHRYHITHVYERKQASSQFKSTTTMQAQPLNVWAQDLYAMYVGTKDALESQFKGCALQ